MGNKAKNGLNKRQEHLFGLTVREYISSAEPVGSGALRQKYNLKLSPATIRNEMVALEKRGLLRQPHHSAGRVPTEDGYRYYVENCLVEGRKISNLPAINKVARSRNESEDKIKRLARELAQELNEGVFIGIGKTSTYYTGLSYLFNQPEFESHDFACQFSSIFDKLDEIIGGLMSGQDDDLKILIGDENPFGRECSTLLLPYGNTDEEQGFLGILGPMRMDYDHVISTMRALEKILNE